MRNAAWNGTTFELTVTSEELSLLLACVREAWEALEGEEFRIRTGFAAAEARKLLSELRQRAQQAKGDA